MLPYLSVPRDGVSSCGRPFHPCTGCHGIPAIPVWRKEMTALAFHVFRISFLRGQTLLGQRQTLLSSKTSCFLHAEGMIILGKDTACIATETHT